MKLKALLLGSATALAVAGGAQAADLSVAEPVDYVRVCDAFGTGYWYIPGTDTCLKIWGFVRWDANYYPESYYHYDFYTAAYIEFSAKSMTDWGPLEAYMGAWQWGFDTAYVSLGPLLAGRTRSTFAQSMPGAFATRDGVYSDWFQTEHYADQIRLSWAMNGFGVMVALEQPDDRGPVYSWQYASSMPDLVAALTWSNAMMDGKVSFVYSQGLNDWANYYMGGSESGGWAVSAGVVLKLDSIAQGDQLLLKAAYGQSAAPYVINAVSWYPWSSSGYGSMWSAMAAFKHYFAPNFTTSIVVNYADAEYWSSGAWQGSFNVSYSPAPTLWITPEVNWFSQGGYSDWWFRLRISKVFY